VFCPLEHQAVWNLWYRRCCSSASKECRDRRCCSSASKECRNWLWQGNTLKRWSKNRTVIPGPKFQWRTVELYTSEASSLCGIFTIYVVTDSGVVCHNGWALRRPVQFSVQSYFPSTSADYAIQFDPDGKRGHYAHVDQLSLKVSSSFPSCHSCAARSCNTAHDCQYVQSVWLILVSVSPLSSRRRKGTPVVSACPCSSP
jgi:hypothetical protein